MGDHIKLPSNPEHRQSLATCYKCKRSSDIKASTLCSGCGYFFHLDCDGYSEKLYKMMDSQKRLKWKCKTCTRKGLYPSNKSISPSANVTMRKTQKNPAQPLIAPKAVNSCSISNSLSSSNAHKKKDATTKSTLASESGGSHSRASTLKSSETNKTEDPTTNSILDSKYINTHPDGTIRSELLLSPLKAALSSSHINTSSSYESDSQIDSVLQLSVQEEILSKSLDYSVNEGLTVLEMKEEINQLSCELASTQNQLEEISIENNGLKRRIERLQTENGTLKKLCQGSNFRSTPGIELEKNKKRHSLHTNNKQAIFTPLNASSRTSSPEISRPKLHLETDGAEIQILKKSIKKMEEELKTYKQEIAFVNTRLDSLSYDLLGTFEENHVFKDKSPTITPEKAEPSLLQSKLCIISNYSNYMIQLMRQAFRNENMCLYLKPGAGTRELFDGLQCKLRDFTLQDFCIIYIGDKDFKKSVNYYRLVNFIQDQVSLVQNTNVIICLPTFKINYSNLFVKRVEIFSNLLYTNNLKHEYYYILDSNLNLSYDNDMFSWHGNVNKKGLLIIFNDLMKLLIFVNSDMNDSNSKCNFTLIDGHDSPTSGQPLNCTNFFRN